MASMIDWGKDIYVESARAVIKRQRNHRDLTVDLLHLVQRQVIHRRFDNIFDGMSDHEITENTADSLCGFIKDIDIYYEMPAI